MSDQPDDPHNLQNRIPGFRQLLFQLIHLLNSSGYTLENIVIAPSTTQQPPQQTSIRYNHPSSTSPMATLTQQPLPQQPLPQQPLPQQPLPQQPLPQQPLPQQPLPQPLQFPPHSLPSPRPKRASTTLLDSPSQQTPPKRKRFSDPRPFWGTVLEQPTQPTQPPLTPPYIPPLHPRAPDRLHRTTTLPTRLHPQPQTPPLPPITSQLPLPPSTTPEILPTRTERRFLKAAGHLLGRLSPFRRQSDQPQPSILPERFEQLPRLRYPDPAPHPPRLPPHPHPHPLPTRVVSPTAERARRGRRPVPPPEHDQFFECELCESKFKRKSDKNRHVRVVHEKSRPFTCPLCAKTFGEKSNMLKHRASVHDDVRTFRCPYCELSFSQRGLCDTHVRTVHDKKQAKYFCEYCGLPFSRKVQLHEHYESDHPEYMASYAGQPSGMQPPPSARTAPQRILDRGGPAPRDPFTTPSRPTQPGPSMRHHGEAGPSNAPLEWFQFQRTTLPQTQQQTTLPQTQQQQTTLPQTQPQTTIPQTQPQTTIPQTLPQTTIPQVQPQTTMLPQLQPQTSNGMHQLPEIPPRPKGYNGESSGNGA